VKQIKYIFKVIDSHTHTGSHRCSDGWKYNYVDSTVVEGPFLSEPLNISYQDLIMMRNHAIEIIKNNTSHEEDYEWAEGYTSNYSNLRIADFGFGSYCNLVLENKYKIHLSLGTVDDCNVPFDTHIYNGIMKLMDDNVEKVRITINNDISSKQKEIAALTKRIEDIKSEMQYINSVAYFDEANIRGIYEILRDNLIAFEVNKPVYKDLYPLDIALFCEDDNLVETLIEQNAHKYSGAYNPLISSRIGDYDHIINILNTEKVKKSDVQLIYRQLSLSTREELIQLISADSREVVLGDMILLDSSQKEIIVNGLSKYYNYATEWDNHGRYSSEFLLSELCRKNEHSLANKVYYWLQSLSHRSIDIDNMLQISFQYGNLEFIKSISPYELITKITDRMEYSYTQKCLIYDPWGDKLAIRWEYEPYIKEECIGKEMCEFILDQINNHSGRYCI